MILQKHIIAAVLPPPWPIPAKSLTTRPANESLRFLTCGLKSLSSGRDTISKEIPGKCTIEKEGERSEEN